MKIFSPLALFITWTKAGRYSVIKYKVQNGPSITHQNIKEAIYYFDKIRNEITPGF